jgi:RNA polymerase sigma-70 factor (ECF subfamily)
MRTIAAHVARDHLRAARRRATWSRQLVDEVAAPASQDSGVGESVALALRRLPPKLQIVATLALIEERPYAEIADVLELPVGTVKSRVFRAIRALRKELAALGIQP